VLAPKKLRDKQFGLPLSKIRKTVPMCVDCRLDPVSASDLREDIADMIRCGPFRNE
jgi:hypothetical protein